MRADRDWFGVDTLGARHTRVREVHVDPYAVGPVYLVRGTHLSVAVDAGSGIVPAGPLVESMCDGPVVSVALTCSYDHAGGWSTFSRRACHRADAAALLDPAAENAEIHDYLTPDRLWALPTDDFELDTYTMKGAEPTMLLEDGDVIDLGDGTLEVMHTPGRSAGGLCLWEAESGTLFTGELLYDGDHGPAWPPDDPAAYAASLRRIGELPVSTVCPGHYEVFDGERMTSLIAEQLDDLESRTLAGTESAR